MKSGKTIVVISSHVARGAVGNRVMVPVLERMGYDVWSVPTISLPYHPGFGRGTCIVPENGQFRSTLEDLVSSGVSDVRAIVSGYLGDKQQADAVAWFVGAVKAAQPQCTYICDPVTGDSRGLYVPVETAEAVRDQLVSIADVITPNRFEHDWMTGFQCASIADWLTSASVLKSPHQIITSVPGDEPGRLGNLLVAPDEALFCDHEEFSAVPHGTGDLLSALTAVRWMRHAPIAEALAAITAGVFKAVRHTIDLGSDDLDTTASNDSTVSSFAVRRIAR